LMMKGLRARKRAHLLGRTAGGSFQSDPTTRTEPAEVANRACEGFLTERRPCWPLEGIGGVTSGGGTLFAPTEGPRARRAVCRKKGASDGSCSSALSVCGGGPRPQVTMEESIRLLEGGCLRLLHRDRRSLMSTWRKAFRRQKRHDWGAKPGRGPGESRRGNHPTAAGPGVRTCGRPRTICRRLEYLSFWKARVSVFMRLRGVR